jgi:hypothetical protein
MYMDVIGACDKAVNRNTKAPSWKLRDKEQKRGKS